MKILLAGEGPTELGGWFDEPPYRGDPPRLGVLVALLAHTGPAALTIVGAIIWKHIRKYRGGVRSAESRTVLGLALEASEAGADVLVFARDNDRDHRQEEIERGILEASERFPSLRIIGSAAVEDTEGWLLAIAGRLHSEAVPNSKAVVASELGLENTTQKAEFVKQMGLGGIPADARSLRRWIDRARAAFGPGGST
ncbi:MAG: hypothetical protein IT370_11530 [Deltaproteobacteria bacterium]|nr:hypothetical protein [Deltaproteobacteria bacterium]